MLVVKNPPANAGDVTDEGSIPGSGRYPRGEQGNPLRSTGLENPRDSGAWQAIVHRVYRVGHHCTNLAQDAISGVVGVLWLWQSLGGRSLVRGQVREEKQN